MSQKRAIVTPILKKQGMDQTVAANYRPISNLTFISKVIERAVAGQLMAYLSEHRMWPATQSAYCGGRSTETALLRVVSNMCEAADSTLVTYWHRPELDQVFPDRQNSVRIIQWLNILASYINVWRPTRVRAWPSLVRSLHSSRTGHCCCLWRQHTLLC